MLAHFGDVGSAWSAPAAELSAAGLDRQYVRAVDKARSSFDGDGEIARLEKCSARALTWLDAGFPAVLRDIPQSPPVLFVRGEQGPSFDLAVAVVGTRRVTPYGRQVAEHFCEALAGAGVAIISGLARGVDAIAHRVALEKGAPTVAVLAGGIDQVYPRENAGLADCVLEHGCLVSEYPVGIPARPDYFPRRNRLLSGLAKATLVVEAGDGSGALHTANWAFEQGRDVLTVPGSVFSRQSEGTNQLIRENTAKLVATPTQLLEELNMAGAGSQLALKTAVSAASSGGPAPRPATTPDEGKLLHWLGQEPLHIDEIARRSGLPISVVSSTLQMMELKGLTRQAGPMQYLGT